MSSVPVRKFLDKSRCLNSVSFARLFREPLRPACGSRNVSIGECGCVTTGSGPSRRLWPRFSVCRVAEFSKHSGTEPSRSFLSNSKSLRVA